MQDMLQQSSQQTTENALQPSSICNLRQQQLATLRYAKTYKLSLEMQQGLAGICRKEGYAPQSAYAPYSPSVMLSVAMAVD